MSYDQTRKLRSLKHAAQQGSQRNIAKGIEHLETAYVADIEDLAIDAAGVLSIDLGGASVVTELKNEDGTYGLVAVHGASGRTVLVQFSEPAVVVEGDDDVEVTFL